jgi:protein involved in sex pheromone biosynthesis
MSTTVTMQDLELETAELLPSRETLNCWHSRSSGVSVTQLNASQNGNTFQSGLINVSALNGNFSGNNVIL